MRENRPPEYQDQLPLVGEGFDGDQLLLSDAAAAANLLLAEPDANTSTPGNVTANSEVAESPYSEVADLVEIGREAGVKGVHLPRFVLEYRSEGGPYNATSAEDHPDNRPTIESVHARAQRSRRRRK